MFLDETNISLSRLSDTGCPHPSPPRPSPCKVAGPHPIHWKPEQNFLFWERELHQSECWDILFLRRTLTSTRGMKSFVSCPRPGTAGRSGGAGPEEKAARRPAPGARGAGTGPEGAKRMGTGFKQRRVRTQGSVPPASRGSCDPWQKGLPGGKLIWGRQQVSGL